MKGKKRQDREDRAAAYREWRMSWGNGCYVNDIDQFEWRLTPDKRMAPVAVLELTRYDGEDAPTDTYFEKILERFHSDAQAQIALAWGDMAGVSAYVVLFRHDLSQFWVHNLAQPQLGWIAMSQDEYQGWLMNKKPAQPLLSKWERQSDALATVVSGTWPGRER